MQILPNLKNLPPHAVIFSYDEKLTKTNIDIYHLLVVMKDWLYLHQNSLPDPFPVSTILEALELVMTQ